MAASSQDSDMGITGINVTPLVDVMLVLLIIFMVTANLIQNKAIAVNLPSAASGDTAKKTLIVIEISKDSTLRVDGKAASASTLSKVIADIKIQDHQEISASVAADRAAPHGAVIDVIDALRQAGVQEFSFTVAQE